MGRWQNTATIPTIREVLEGGVALHSVLAAKFRFDGAVDVADDYAGGGLVFGSKLLPRGSHGLAVAAPRSIEFHC